MKKFVDMMIGIFLGLLIAGLLFLTARAPAGKPVELLPSPTPQPIVVYVTGAVKHAGVFKLPPESRMVDAVQAAGGFAEGADLNQVNLATVVNDGQQVVIPGLSTLPTPELTIGENGLLVVPTPFVGEVINVNAATKEQILGLHCLSEHQVDLIIERRAEELFTSLDNLSNRIPGIGPEYKTCLENKINFGS